MKKTKKLLFILFATMMLLIPQVSFANSENSGESVKIVIDYGEKFYGENERLESLHSLGIKDEYLVTNAKKFNYYYSFIYKDKAYKIVKEAAKEVSPTTTKDVSEIHRYDQDSIRPREFGFGISSYPSNPILEKAVQEFKEVNEGSNGFDQQIKNAMKTVYGMDLIYGGGTHDQGNLDNGMTMCDGFTWIMSELLDETDIMYRFVLVSPKYKLDESSRQTLYKSGESLYHIYLEAFNKDKGIWVKIENTELDRNRVRELKGLTIDEKIDNLLEKFYTLNTNLLEDKVWVLKEYSENTFIEYYFISEEYLRGKKIGDISYEVKKTMYDNGTTVLRSEL